MSGEVTAADTKLSAKKIIESIVARCEGARWVPVGETKKSCVDGRGQEPIIGVPGGDAGLFMAMLATVEKMATRRFDAASVRKALELYIATVGNGNFYFHTDEHAERSGQDPNSEVGPKDIGCGHLRLAATDTSSSYDVRHELVTEIMRALNQRAAEAKQAPADIDGDKTGVSALTPESVTGNNVDEGLDFDFNKSPGVEKVVLKKDHEEVAVLVVKSIDGDQVPAIAPTYNGVQMFIFHEAVVAKMAEKIAQNLKKILGEEEGGQIDAREFEIRFVSLFIRQTMATVQSLALDRGLEIYDVVVGRAEGNAGTNEVSVKIRSKN